MHPYKAYFKQLMKSKFKFNGFAEGAGFSYEVNSDTDQVKNALMRVETYKKSKVVEFLGTLVIFITHCTCISVKMRVHTNIAAY